MSTGSRLILNDEIILSGDVLLDDYVAHMYYDEVYFSPRMVREALAILGEGEVTVRLNSMGGHSDAGEAIRSILASHPGGARIIVEGVAASAASLIFMAGSRRVMSGGSHLMIHDPSNYTFGNEEQMRRAADQIAVIANTYAAVYAAASGKTAEEVRAIMKAETWFGAEAAVAEGFADEIIPLAANATPPPPDMAAAKVVYMSAHKRLAQRLSEDKPDEAARPDHDPAAMRGAPTEKDMSKPNPTPAVPTPTQAQQPAPATMSAQDAVTAERTRMRAIRDMAAPFLMSGRLAQAEVDAAIDEGVTSEAAGVRFMTVMAAAEPKGRSGTSIEITRDETETKVEGMIGALMRKTDGPAEQYRGMRVKRLAMEMAGSKRGFDDAAAIRQGMMSTTMMGGAYGVSDFAYITTEVMRRTIIAEYARRNATWTLVAGTPITAADFREQHAVRVGGDFALKPVAENGEYTQASLIDQGEGLKVERRGRTITLTFEAIVNDDMGAFDRIPREFVIAARNMENSMVWDLFRKNAKLKSDNKALFHADHNNLAASGGGITPATIAAARKAMWEQRPYGSKDTDDFLQLEADILLVPPALELIALQFTTAVTPGKDADVNPFKSRFQPSVIPNLGAAAGGSDTAWYAISSDRPPVQVAYLEGYEAPTVQTIEGMNPDVVKMNARHIFGAAATEFVGAYKNPGA